MVDMWQKVDDYFDPTTFCTSYKIQNTNNHYLQVIAFKCNVHEALLHVIPTIIEKVKLFFKISILN